MTNVLYRLVCELACLCGCTCAAVLAYNDKSAWVWSWFLLFDFYNTITGTKTK